MQYTQIQKDQFTVVGITVRTTNEKNRAMKDIKNLWDKFYMDRIMDKVPQKLNDDVICLYTDYEKDFTRPYSVILGYQVSHIDNLPKELISKIVPTSQYAVFHVKGNNIVRQVVKLWQWIPESNLKMSYKGNFEIYKPPNGNDATVYVAIQ